MLIEDAADVINACHDQETAHGWNSLSHQEQVIVLSSDVDFEVMLGGMIGYFCNSAGDRVHEAIQALNEIGATGAAAALTEALAEFPHPNRVRDRGYREDFIASEDTTHLVVYALRYHDQTPSVRELLEDYAMRWYRAAGRRIEDHGTGTVNDRAS